MASMAQVEFYANDTHPILVISLDDGDPDAPQPLDLTEVQTVLFKVAESFEAEDNLFVGECEVVGDPKEGVVQYQFKSGELSAGGRIGEVSLIYTDYTVLTMPHFKLKVKPDLPGPDVLP